MPTVAAMSIRERLRLVFRGADVEAPTTDEPAVPSAPTTELEVVAYAEDCRLFGHLALSAARLTDMLNEADEIELVDVAVEALADGRIVEMRSMVVRRDELLVVQATGPRGARERRQRTRPHPVAFKTGPYLVRGLLHALPTADPFVALRRRPPMVPLTDGSISYTVAGSTVVRRADTIIVNRAVIDWVTPGTDDEVAGPELPALPAAKGILLKDFTGEITRCPMTTSSRRRRSPSRRRSSQFRRPRRMRSRRSTAIPSLRLRWTPSRRRPAPSVAPARHFDGRVDARAESSPKALVGSVTLARRRRG